MPCRCPGWSRAQKALCQGTQRWCYCNLAVVVPFSAHHWLFVPFTHSLSLHFRYEELKTACLELSRWHGLRPLYRSALPRPWIVSIRCDLVWRFLEAPFAYAALQNDHRSLEGQIYTPYLHMFGSHPPLKSERDIQYKVFVWEFPFLGAAVCGRKVSASNHQFSLYPGSTRHVVQDTR